jgi:hypothetical protein
MQIQSKEHDGLGAKAGYGPRARLLLRRPSCSVSWLVRLPVSHYRLRLATLVHPGPNASVTSYICD